MQLRCLRTTASASPAYPFQPGQIITIERLTPDWKKRVEAGDFELMRDERLETAVKASPEVAAVRHGKA